MKELKDYMLAVDFLIGNLEVVLDEYDLDGFNDNLDKKIKVVRKFENKLIESIKKEK